MEHYSDHIAKLRTALENVLDPEKLLDDDYLFRFLKARNFDLSRAEQMIKLNIEWRTENCIDTFLLDYQKPEVFKKFYSFTRLGFAKDGSVLWFGKVGRIDMKGFIQILGIKEILKFIVWIMEDSLEVMKKQNSETQSKNVTFVADLEGFSFSQAIYPSVMSTYVNMVGIMDRNYPEMLRKLIFINASRLSTTTYSLIKPLLNPNTAAKIHLYSSSDDWKSVLLTDIDAELLPEHWGGTRKDGTGEPDCPELINRGGPIPAEFYPKK